MVDNVATGSVNGAAALPLASARTYGLNLFLTGFLVLFLELASIRWFAATVIFLQFFTNVVLLASFLGMSCGCMVAHKRRDWLAALAMLLLAVTLPDMAFGSNIAGSVVGGLVESVSMLLGFQYLLLLAIVFYLLSAWFAPSQARTAS